MRAAGSVLHLRSGEAAAREMIDAWLRAHGLACTDLADALEACVHLVQHRNEFPELAFVGVDGLAADERRIIGYIRETWPATGVILYSCTGEAVTGDLGPQTHVCRSLDALQRLLTDSPDGVIQRLRQGNGVARNRMDAPLGGARLPTAPVPISAASRPPAASHAGSTPARLRPSRYC